MNLALSPNLIHRWRLRNCVPRILALILLAVPAAQAQFRFVSNNGAITITGLNYDYFIPLNPVPLEIPATIYGLPVTGIGDRAFWDIALTPPPYGNVIYLTSVTIPNSVTNIGAGAFYESQYLMTVTIGDGITTIENEAFYGCSMLSQVIFQGNAPLLGGGVFQNDNSTIVYYLPGTTGWGPTFGGRPTVLWTLQDQLDYQTNNGAITITGYRGLGGAVNLPATINGLPITSIADGAFSPQMPWQRPNGLTSIVIGDGVTNIGTYAFVGCSALTSITIPNSVTSIGNSAFANCSALTNVTIPSRLTSIADATFQNCAYLPTIQIPDTVTNIGAWAFSGCARLTSVAISSNLTGLGRYAFEHCSLTSIIIPDSTTDIGDSAFSGCIGLTNVAIGNGVVIIGDSAFYWCANLSDVTIGYRVTNIEHAAFLLCTSLVRVHFQGNAPGVGSGVFDSDNSAIVYYLPGTTGWGWTLGGRPTAPWVLPNPVILNFGPSFGAQANGFGFIVSWAAHNAVIVEATKDLTSWLPLQTNTLNGGWSYFTDPNWTNLPARFYRVHSP